MNNLKTPEVNAFTSFTYSYLPRAMVLAKTLKHFNPSWHLTAIISDRKPEELSTIDLLAYFDKVIHIEELDVNENWIFKHNIVELCTAVKGIVIHRMLEEGAKKVIYFDPDIAIFNNLLDLEKKLDYCSILLTPHQLRPEITNMAIVDNEICSLKHGAYNLGFIGVKNDINGKEFSRWWKSRLIEFCYDDIQSGLFTDQKWCDLIPSMFENVHILKDPGYNVSSWNLSNRHLTMTNNGEILVNNSELKFYHFSKVNDIGLLMTIRYGGNNTEIYSLWYWYKSELNKQKHLLNIDRKFNLETYWYFNEYTSKTKISMQSRVNFRNRLDFQEHYINPFSFSNDDFERL